MEKKPMQSFSISFLSDSFLVLEFLNVYNKFLNDVLIHSAAGNVVFIAPLCTCLANLLLPSAGVTLSSIPG